MNRSIRSPRAERARRRRRRGRRAGFTLVEALVGVSLFGIVALGATALFISLMSVSSLNAHHAAATELAQAELEDLRSLAYDDISARESTATVGGIEYAIATAVQDATPAANMKTIDVTVSWVDQGGGSREFSVGTVYAEINP
jgi:prepilin-type N-terminal cleavage/methylation domain-containing protein